MKTIPAPLLTHIRGPLVTLAVCWRVQRKDGELILGTEHDRDLTVSVDSNALTLVGTYRASSGITGSDLRSNSDMAVDNMEVSGAVASPDDLSIVDLTVADIEGGLFDDAPMTLFLVNWQAPDDGQIILRHGTIGEIRRTSDGHYYTELRGLAQRLQQQIVETYSQTCQASLGDSRCQFNTAPHIINGTVSSVTSRLRFDAAMDTAGDASIMYSFGKLTFTDGANVDITREVRTPAVGDVFGDIQTFEPFPFDIEVGDQFTLAPGCDKSSTQCQLYNNFVNFRGHGLFVPTQGASFGVAMHTNDIVRDN